jgi:hypothetical protein
MGHEIRNGKMEVPLSSLDAVHHCNLSCRACNHFAPMADEYAVDPAQVARDLSALGHYYHSQIFALCGGEPLLHPQLPDVIAAVRRSGIADHIRVYTNGLLLRQAPEALWRSVDSIRVTVYPGTIGRGDIREARRRARAHGVYLAPVYSPTFRETFSELGTVDDRLVSRIFSSCQFAHVYQCHAVCDGYLYRCPRGAYIPRYAQRKSGAELLRDGLKIAPSSTFADDLWRFLHSQEPLAACRHCLGSVGRAVPHVQEPRGSLRPPRSTEELLDWRRLEKLERTGSPAPPSWLQAVTRLWHASPSVLRTNPKLLRFVAAIRERVK